MSLFAVVYDKNINSVVTVVRSKLPLHIKNRQIAKSKILQFYLAPKIAKLNTRKIWLMIFARNSFNQVNMVCHTYYCKKNRRVVYLVLRAAFSC